MEKLHDCSIVLSLPKILHILNMDRACDQQNVIADLWVTSTDSFCQILVVFEFSRLKR